MTQQKARSSTQLLIDFPQGLYTATKASIEALSGVPAGACAYASDNPTAPFGTFNGASWDWQTLAGGGEVYLVMETGVTFPPVPLTNAEGTDWIYSS